MIIVIITTLIQGTFNYLYTSIGSHNVKHTGIRVTAVLFNVNAIKGSIFHEDKSILLGASAVLLSCGVLWHSNTGAHIQRGSRSIFVTISVRVNEVTFYCSSSNCRSDLCP